MKIKEMIKEFGKRENLTQNDMYKLAGFKHRSNFTVSVNKESIKLKDLDRLAKSKGWKVVLIKNKNKIEL